jgi:hypothetical protein
MRECDIEQLAADYLHEVVKGRAGDGRDAADRVQSLVFYDPESAWEVAFRVLQLADSEASASVVGAGIIEQLLGSYPEQFMPRATELTVQDSRMRRAMKYVDIRADEIPAEYFRQFERIQEQIRAGEVQPADHTNR